MWQTKYLLTGREGQKKIRRQLLKTHICKQKIKGKISKAKTEVQEQDKSNNENRNQQFLKPNQENNQEIIRDYSNRGRRW